MPFTLAYLDTPMPAMPEPGLAVSSRPADRREHFGTEEAALRRAASLLPGPIWLDLRLYGPDGRRLARQDELSARLGLSPGQTDTAAAPAAGAAA